MISDEYVLVLGKRLDDGGKKMKEVYAGKFYDEPVTIVYKQIRNIETNRTNWSVLSSNLKPYPCVISLQGYLTQSIDHTDYLIKVFEGYRYTVQELTGKKGWKWTETQLLRTLVELTNTCYMISKNGDFTPLQSLCPGRLLVTNEGQVKLPMLKRTYKKADKLNPFLPPDCRSPQNEGWAEYALAATVLYMALGGFPNSIHPPYNWPQLLSFIHSTHPILHSLLSLYLSPSPDRYHFSDLRAHVSLGNCFSLVRLNQIAVHKQLRLKSTECELVLREMKQATTRIKAESITLENLILKKECPSCSYIQELQTQLYIYRCRCGALNSLS